MTYTIVIPENPITADDVTEMMRVADFGYCEGDVNIDAAVSFLNKRISEKSQAILPDAKTKPGPANIKCDTCGEPASFIIDCRALCFKHRQSGQSPQLEVKEHGSQSS